MPIHRNNFPHVVRDSTLEAEIVAPGEPIAICTLAGEAKSWSELTPHEFKAFPLQLYRVDHTPFGQSTNGLDAFRTRVVETGRRNIGGKQLTVARAPDPSPLRGTNGTRARGYDDMFLRSHCPHCSSSKCDMRITGHWTHRDDTAPDGVTL